MKCGCVDIEGVCGSYTMFGSIYCVSVVKSHTHTHSRTHTHTHTLSVLFDRVVRVIETCVSTV